MENHPYGIPDPGLGMLGKLYIQMTIYYVQIKN